MTDLLNDTFNLRSAQETLDVAPEGAVINLGSICAQDLEGAALQALGLIASQLANGNLRTTLVVNEILSTPVESQDSPELASEALSDPVNAARNTFLNFMTGNMVKDIYQNEGNGWLFSMQHYINELTCRVGLESGSDSYLSRDDVGLALALMGFEVMPMKNQEDPEGNNIYDVIFHPEVAFWNSYFIDDSLDDFNGIVSIALGLYLGIDVNEIKQRFVNGEGINKKRYNPPLGLSLGTNTYINRMLYYLRPRHIKVIKQILTSLLSQ